MNRFYFGGGISGKQYAIIKSLYLKNKFTKALVMRYINKYEGGQYCSSTLRSIWREAYDIDVGFGSYGCFTNLFRPHIKIGKYCSIAHGVSRLVGNHPMNIFSTHPFFHLKQYGYCDDSYYEEHYLQIGNDVWIGENAIITSGCEMIGDGAVIGAGAIVTHNVEPYAVVAGNPARLLRYRFDEITRNQLSASQWWDLPPCELAKLMPFRDDINVFIQEVNRLKRESRKNEIDES